MQDTSNPPAAQWNFPPFSLARLLRTVFAPDSGERVCILIDLENPREEVRDFAFLKNPALTIQQHAYEHFYLGLKRGVLKELGLTGGEFFAYKITGGSNLDLPDEAYAPDGRELNFKRDIYPNFDLILCVSTFSATAPLTAFAKKFGFRGATLHGLNPIILSSGLAVDYNEVSRKAEKLRLGMTGADSVEIDFSVDGQNAHAPARSRGAGSAKKPRPLPRRPGCGEPARGRNLLRAKRRGRRVSDALRGRHHRPHAGRRRAHPRGLADPRRSRQPSSFTGKSSPSDPVTGELGELGFGTQELPPSGRDIQDEKILGTIHVATGRSDHLGGHLTPDKFADAKNATHDDILFSPTKTPDINVPQVRMTRNGETKILIENYQPVFMRELLEKARA